MRTTRLVGLPLLLAGGLLAGCSGGATEPADTPTPSEAPADDADAAEEEAPDDAVAGPASAECLEGTWEVDQESVSRIMSAAFAALGAETPTGMDVAVDVQGATSITFADGAYTGAHEDVVTSIAMDMEGMEFLFTTSQAGTVTGTYTVDEDQLTISDLDLTGVTSELAMTVDGQAIPDSGMDEGMEDMGSLAITEGSSTFTCAGDELTMVPEVPDDVMGVGEMDLTMTYHRR